MQEDCDEPRIHEIGVGREGARHTCAAHAPRSGEGGRRALQRLRGEERGQGLALPGRPVPVMREFQHRGGEGGPPRGPWGRGWPGGGTRNVESDDDADRVRRPPSSDADAADEDGGRRR
jgi:hypothetical protein